MNFEFPSILDRGRNALLQQRNVLILGVGRVTEALLNVALIRIYSQILSTTEVGRLSLILAVCGFFMQLFVSTSGSFFLRQITEWRAEGRLVREVLHFSTFLVLVVPLAAIILLAGCQFVPSLGAFSYWTLLALVVSSIALQGGQLNFVNGINILGHRAMFVLLSNTNALLSLSLAFAAVVIFGRTAVIWQGGYIAGLTIVLPAILLVLWRNRKPGQLSHAVVPVAGVFGRGALDYVLPLVLVAMSFWVQNFGYRLILASRASESLLGIFTIGITLGTLPVLLITKIANDYLVPPFLRRIAHRDEAAKVDAWQPFALHYISVGLIAAPILAAAAHFYCRFIAGPDYWNYAWLAWFGAGFQLLTTIYAAHLQLAQAMMNNRIIVWANLASSAVILVGVFALTPHSPLIGPGIAMIIGGVTLVLLSALNLRRLYKTHMPCRPLVLALALGCSCAAAVQIIAWLVPSPSMIECLGGVALAGLGLLGCLGYFLWKHPVQQ